MWVASDDIINKFKCSQCDLYVKNAPIFYGDDVGLLCQWCASILPTNGAKYSRQNGLELMVEHIIFPCRYETFGCPKRACGDQLHNHEERCKFRNKTLQKGISITSDETESSMPLQEEAPGTPFSVHSGKFFPIRTESKGLNVEMNCTAKGNKTTKKLTVLKYSINIIADENKQLCLVNNSRRSKFLHSDYVQPIELVIDGAISLKHSPSNLYCDLKLLAVDENMNTPLISETCKSCNGNYFGDKLHCGYGHTLCTSCKRTPCNECAKLIEALTTISCTNFGCLWRGPDLNLHEHEKDCPNANLHCAFSGCDWKSPELLMKSHINQVHTNYFHSTDTLVNEFTQDDQLWIMSSFNKLFICKYYNYLYYIEIIVELYSKTSVQNRFTYTIEILSRENEVVKSVTNACSIFNHSILERAVSITPQELKTPGNKQFRITIGHGVQMRK